MSFYQSTDRLRNHYLGHLTDVVMVDAYMLASERLGGADYDGDMIKTIAEPYRLCPASTVRLVQCARQKNCHAQGDVAVQD